MPSHIHHFIRKTQEKLRTFQGKVDAMRQKRDAPDAPRLAPSKEKREKIELVLSSGTIAKTVAITMLLALVGLFVYEIRDILVIFFVSLLFAAALDPMVDALERRKIPRSIGVIIIYLAVLLALGFLIANLAPVIATELSELAVKVQDFIGNLVKGEIELPRFLERLRPIMKRFFEGIDVSKVSNYKDIILQIAQNLSNVAGNVVNAVLVTFNGLFNTIIVLVLTFLMTVDESGIDRFILSLFPARHAAYIRHKSVAIKEKMGYWLRGQVVLCIIVGVLVYIGLLIVGLFTKKIEYAATIALVAGFTELIPYAGPFIAWIIALPIVANQSVVLILWLTALMYFVQVLENNFIVPIVMNKAVGISPIFIMFSMFVGFSFLGVLGIVLSVPVATAVALFVKDYAEREK